MESMERGYLWCWLYIKKKKDCFIIISKVHLKRASILCRRMNHFSLAPLKLLHTDVHMMHFSQLPVWLHTVLMAVNYFPAQRRCLLQTAILSKLGRNTKIRDRRLLGWLIGNRTHRSRNNKFITAGKQSHFLLELSTQRGSRSLSPVCEAQLSGFVLF